MGDHDIDKFPLPPGSNIPNPSSSQVKSSTFKISKSIQRLARKARGKDDSDHEDSKSEGNSSVSTADFGGESISPEGGKDKERAVLQHILPYCEPGSSAHQKWQMSQLLLLSFIPIIALIAQNTMELTSLTTGVNEALQTRDQVTMSSEIGRLLSELQQERAELGFCLFTTGISSSSSQGIAFGQSSRTRGNESLELDLIRGSTSTTLPTVTTTSGRHTIKGGGVTTSTCRISLLPRFYRTDAMIQNLSSYLSSFVPTAFILGEKRKLIFQLVESTGSTDDTTLDELIWYNVANDVILELLSQRIQETKSTSLWKPLMAYMQVIKSIENYSVSMVYGLYYFGTGGLSQKSFNSYLSYDALAAEYLSVAKSYSPEVSATWEEFITKRWVEKGSFNGSLETRKNTILRNVASETVGGSGDAQMYFANMTDFIGELRKFQMFLKEYIDGQVQEEITSTTIKQLTGVVLLCAVVVVSPLLLLSTKKVTKTIQTYASDVKETSKLVKREKRRADNLLSQMMPRAVIETLKKRKQVPAEYFPSVTIYFSDIVSFTKLSATFTPMETIIMLNSLYEVFDNELPKYDVYKVETIGDAYMVASGLPLPNGIRHAGEISAMALALLGSMKRYRIPHRPATTLEIRIGVNSGPCVAGVVGTKMPRYCLFGDCINVASRMESHGEAMKIHISDSTKQLLDEIGGFHTEPRGVINIKGKGDLPTYWLVGMDEDKHSHSKKGGGDKEKLMFVPNKPVGVPQFMHELFGSEEDSEDVVSPLKAKVGGGQGQGQAIPLKEFPKRKLFFPKHTEGAAQCNK